MERDIASQLGMDGPDINAIREAIVAKEFSDSARRRAFILISSYPFLIIGEILNVVSDYLEIKAEVTNGAELDNEVFKVHIDDIEVFYIEKDGKKIPDIRDVHYD